MPDEQLHRKGSVSPQPATGIQNCAHLWQEARGRVYLRGSAPFISLLNWTEVGLNLLRVAEGLAVSHEIEPQFAKKVCRSVAAGGADLE